MAGTLLDTYLDSGSQVCDRYLTHFWLYKLASGAVGAYSSSTLCKLGSSTPIISVLLDNRHSNQI